MRKLVLLLSCLVCWTAAGRLGVEQKRLWWLHGGPIMHQQVAGMGQRDIGMSTVNQRQKWLLDVLLQVQKPLVNARLIEMGKILLDDGAMYTEPSDEDLQAFLEVCRAHDLLGHGDIYSVMNVQHARQLLGLYKFLVLARDWSVFTRNVCFARLHVNPVMYVEALMLAVRDRSDTQDLIMPAVEEILPQLFFEHDVIAAAQNIDWASLSAIETTTKPTLLNVLGLWRPWHDWRMHMMGVASGRAMPLPTTITRQPNERNILVSGSSTIVVSEEGDVRLGEDVSLNMFWDNMIIENVLQMLKERRLQSASPVIGNRMATRQDISDKRGMMNMDDIIGINIDKSNRNWPISPLESRQSINDISNKRGMIRETIVGSRPNSGLRDISGINVGSLPATDISDERLLHINRRRLDNNGDEMETSRTDRRQWHQDIDDDIDMDSKRSDHRYRLGGIVNDRQMPQNAWVGKQKDDNVWSRIQTVNPIHLPMVPIDNDRLVHVNQRRMRQDVHIPKGSGYYERNHGDDELWNGMRADLSRQNNEHIVDGDRLMARRTMDDSESMYHVRRVRSIDAAAESAASGRLLIERSGEIMLQNMQQLVARLQMEEIALRLENTASHTQHLNPLMMATNGMMYQQQHWDQSKAELIEQTVVQHLKSMIDAAIERVPFSSRNRMSVVRVIGDILMGRNDGSSIWREILMQLRRDAVIGNDDHIMTCSIGCLRNPVYQSILTHMVQLVEDYMQRLPAYSVEEVIAKDLQINDVDVDRLITYMAAADTDLINVIDQQLLQSGVDNIHRLEKQVVARQQRLNHHPFTITLDVTSQRSQRVVVRLFIGPKIDELGRTVQLPQSRTGFILLDAFVKNLQPGTNIFQHSSVDIAGTTRAISTLSAIYRHIMTGQTMRDLVGQNCRLPHRLLLPRGTVDGLPMQLLAIVTPVTDIDRDIQQTVMPDQLCGLGIAGAALDRLPLNFPLDRKIVDSQMLMLPNIFIKDTIIQHDDRTRVTASGI